MRLVGGSPLCMYPCAGALHRCTSPTITSTLTRTPGGVPRTALRRAESGQPQRVVHPDLGAGAGPSGDDAHRRGPRIALLQPKQSGVCLRADDGAHRHLGDLLPHYRLPNVAAVDRAGVPDLLDGPRHALGVSPRFAGERGDRRVVAAPGDRRCPRDVGGRRPNPSAHRAPPDGAAGVGASVAARREKAMQRGTW